MISRSERAQDRSQRALRGATRTRRRLLRPLAAASPAPLLPGDLRLEAGALPRGFGAVPAAAQPAAVLGDAGRGNRARSGDSAVRLPPSWLTSPHQTPRITQ